MKIKLTLLKRLSINMKATLPIRQDGKLLKELDLILNTQNPWFSADVLSAFAKTT